VVGALEQNAMKDKLEGIQADQGSKFLEEPNKEVKYLKK